MKKYMDPEMEVIMIASEEITAGEHDTPHISQEIEFG